MAALFDLDTERDTRTAGVQGDRGSNDGRSNDGRSNDGRSNDGRSNDGRSDDGGSDDAVDEAFALIGIHIRGLEPRDALKRIRSYRASLSALELEVLTSQINKTGNNRTAKRLLDDGKTSRRTISKAARRADAATKNAGLVDKVGSGQISDEHLDVIADAASKTGGDAAVDESFIDKVAAVDPDQAQGIADTYVADRTTAKDAQTEHDRQRALRRGFRYAKKKNGLDAITLEGDTVTITNIWNKIKDRSNSLYHADGGRDVATGQHPRTNDQRRFDAATELICGITTRPNSTGYTPRDGADGGGAVVKPGKPQVFVGLTLDKYLGIDRTAVATQIGIGAIPDSVLADYLEHADIISALYDRDGEPLWLGRTKRHPTVTQRSALVMRDKGCVLCNAPHDQCEAHHLMPWNAPGKGHTNLDQLALLCGACHRRLHAENHTLYRHHNGSWRTRPATSYETPPPPPADRRHPQRE